MIDTIWIESGYSGREAVKSMVAAKQLGYKVGWGKAPNINICAPIGSVDYCESWLSFRPLPNFFPEWLHDWFHRKIQVKKQAIADKDIFVKSAERYKEWPARVFKTGENLPEGLLLISEVVEFVQEWRYYVSDGTVLTTGWYDGIDEDEPAPVLNIDWQKGWCGAADFGRLSTGEIALVECQHPYACGWYGDDHPAYVMWVVEGWEYMKRISNALETSNRNDG